MDDKVKNLVSPVPDFAVWVRSLEAHSLANEDRMMNDQELEGLKASIRTYGLRVPIKVFEGKILDGRNRHKAGIAVGYRFKPSDFEYYEGTPATAKKYADDLNLHRRHLTADDKNKRVLKMLEDHPEWSNRKIAELCDVSHTTVGNQRKDKTDDEADYKKFTKEWQNLSDKHRERFVLEFSPELARVASS
jgi:ParB-like chromosome segregation protein Spo0J